MNSRKVHYVLNILRSTKALEPSRTGPRVDFSLLGGCGKDRDLCPGLLVFVGLELVSFVERCARAVRAKGPVKGRPTGLRVEDLLCEPALIDS